MAEQRRIVLPGGASGIGAAALALFKACRVTGSNIECDGGLTAQIEYAVLTGSV